MLHFVNGGFRQCYDYLECTHMCLPMSRYRFQIVREVGEVLEIGKVPAFSDSNAAYRQPRLCDSTCVYSEYILWAELTADDVRNSSA